jgi:hypothetical protein
MSEPNEWPAILEQLQDGSTITPADFLLELRRIADALEATSAKTHCGDVEPGTREVCVLGLRHVGHHTNINGKRHWLDEE